MFLQNVGNDLPNETACSYLQNMYMWLEFTLPNLFRDFMFAKQHIILNIDRAL
jgi:hypothetical protein